MAYYSYEFINGTEISLNKYKGLLNEIIIPERIDSFIVKEIGESYFENSGITEIKICNNVEKIKDEAFKNCKSLKNIIFSNKLKSIDIYAFKNCISLKEIELPKEMERLGLLCFAKCENLETVKLPKNIKIINNGIFFECFKLKTIIYPDTYEKFIQIKGWKHIFDGNKLTINDVQFHKTLEELIDDGKSIREANKILKEQEEQAI